MKGSVTDEIKKKSQKLRNAVHLFFSTSLQVKGSTCTLSLMRQKNVASHLLVNRHIL